MTTPLRIDTTATPVLLAILATGLLTAMDGLIKSLAAHYSMVDVVFARYLAGVLTALPVLLYVRPAWPGLATVRAHAMRAVLLVATSFFFYTALSLLPIVEAVSLRFVAPLFMAILGYITLRESVSPAMGLAMALGFAGCLVIAIGKGLGSSGLPLDVLGIAAALAGACTYAAAIVMLRARTRTDHLVMIVMLQNSFAGAYALPVALTLGSPLDILTSEWRMLILVGLLGTSGHLLLAAAIARAQAAKIGAVEYTSLVWAALIGVFVWGEWPSLTSIAGAALIIASSFTLAKKPART